MCHPTIVLQAAASLQAPGVGCSSAVAMCWRQLRMLTLSSLTKPAPSQLANQWSRQVLSRCIVRASGDCMQHWTTQTQSIHQRRQETHLAVSNATQQAVAVADGTGMDAARVLALAAALERRANHPIAAAIAAHAEQQGEHSTCCRGGVDPGCDCVLSACGPPRCVMLPLALQVHTSNQPTKHTVTHQTVTHCICVRSGGPISQGRQRGAAAGQRRQRCGLWP